MTADIDPENGGKVEYKGADWSARCTTPLSAGAKAVIESADGITLVVTPKI